MDGLQDYRATYEMRRVIFFGAAAGSSLVFFVLGLIFLNSGISYHSFGNSDTISEMMGYAEFFLFAYGSYFLAAILVLRYADFLAKAATSWLPIALFGSLFFSTSFLIRVWVSDLITYQEPSPFRAPPSGVGMLVLSIVIVAGISFFVTSIGCGIASSFFSSKQVAHVVPR